MGHFSKSDRPHRAAPLRGVKRTLAAAGVAGVAAGPVSLASADVDNLVKYFSGPTSTNVLPGSDPTKAVAIGAFTYDAATDSFWTFGFTNANQQIRNLAFNGTSWAPTGGDAGGPANDGHVSETSWLFYKRSDDFIYTSNPNEIPGLRTSGQPMTGGVVLNAIHITINAGSFTHTYQPGELLLVNDSWSVWSQETSPAVFESRPQFTKRLYWYNLTETDSPNPGDGSIPDYNNNGMIEWNEQFFNIIDHDDLNAADPDRTVGDALAVNQGRSFGMSTDGRYAYINDSATNYGGVFKVDVTTPDTVIKPLDVSGINTEPGVVHTSVHDFAGAGAGDQILVEGHTGANAGGLNAYLDQGSTFSAPAAVFTQAQLQAFLETTGNTSIAAVKVDASGKVYFVEDGQRDALFVYDPATGNFVKVVSAAERAAFRIQASAHDAYNASILDLQLRESTSPGFSVTEVLYSDSAFDAPIGVLAFKPGDFDRDNDVDAADKAAFLAALKTRGTGMNVSDLYRFDLNGSSSGATASHSATVDWKDVKVLQDFLGFADGDVNLDMSVDYADLDILFANYYTLGGPADKTWLLGDITSEDPLYLTIPADWNLVNEHDVNLLALTWDLPIPTLQDLLDQSYSGQFLTDVVAAFGITAVPSPAALPGGVALLGLAAVRRKRRNR